MYRLGLDIGTTSIGWAVLALDNENNPYKIIDLGVTTFKTNQTKDGSSLAVARRKARSARRLTRRRSHRILRADRLFVRCNLIAKKDLSALYSPQITLPDPYRLRSEALDRKLSDKETVVVLRNLLKRRGYLSNRKSDSQKDEDGAMLSNIQKNNNILLEKGYRTVGEMLYLDPLFAARKRNKFLSGKSKKKEDVATNYTHTFSRSAIKEELEKIFEAQERFGNPFITKDFKSKYVKIFTDQRHYAKGPGGASPYRAKNGSLAEDMYGYCTFEPDMPRASKNTYTAERYMVLTRLVNLQIQSPGGKPRFLSPAEFEKVLEKIYTQENTTYKSVRKVLKLKEDETFKGLAYGAKVIKSSKDKSKIDKDKPDVGSGKESSIELVDVEKENFAKLSFYSAIKKEMDKIAEDHIKTLTLEQLDEIGYALSVFEVDNEIEDHLIKAGLDSKEIELLKPLSFKGTANLSLKAMRKLIPHLEKGINYSTACANEGYDHSSPLSPEPVKKLPSVESQRITNPVVKKALGICVKQINSITRVYGPPDSIHIEVARDFGVSKKKKDAIAADNKKRQAVNDHVKFRLKKMFEGRSLFRNGEPSMGDVVKLKLYEDQNGICPYSTGPADEKIDLHRLFEDGYVEVDHIIPYSVSFNDSYNNKVLVLCSKNREKGSRTPYEYFGNDKQRWDRFNSLIRMMHLPPQKKNNLLRENITEEDILAMQSRPLNDTSYIIKELKRHLSRYMMFSDRKDDKCRNNRIVCVMGSITGFARRKLGLTKDRKAGDLHHAMDAVVVAAIDYSYMYKLGNYLKNVENKFTAESYVDVETGEIIDKKDYNALPPGKRVTQFVEFWPSFRDELLARLSDDPKENILKKNISTYAVDEVVRPVFAVKVPTRKIKGQIHEETILSPKERDNQKIVKRVSIKDLKLNKDGEIEGYYKPERDPLLYNALREKLLQGGKSEDGAFTEPFYKPLLDGRTGPEVKKVKIEETATSVVSINQGKGCAKNGKMVRADIFIDPESKKHYVVPVYVSDTAKATLPMQACNSQKPKMDENYDFKFSLYPNDLIYFKYKPGKKGSSATYTTGEKRFLREGYVYYDGLDISNGTLSFCGPDSSFMIRGMGILNTLDVFEKWNTDYLGNKTRVRHERRQEFGKK